MFLSGKGYSEIARYYGVSRQCIHSHFTSKCVRMARRGRPLVNSIVYKGISDWMDSKNMNLTDVARQVFGNDKISRADTARITNTFNGKRNRETVLFIKQILKATGLTFEEAFAEEGEA